MNYFKDSGIKMRVIDDQGQAEYQMNESESGDDRQSNDSRKDTKTKSGRVRKTKELDANMEEYDDESDDEDFNDDGSGGSDDESGEDEEGSESDMDMIDESVDKEELKNLQKGVQLTDGKRKRNQDK